MDKKIAFDYLDRICKGLALTFGSNCETLIQDMTKPSHPILSIYNAHVSGRSINSEEDIYGNKGIYDETVFQGKDYVNTLVITKDNRYIKSSTLNFKGDGYHYALGINFDFTTLAMANKALADITSVGIELEKIISDDANVQIEEAFSQCLSAVGKPINKMVKSERLYLVKLLYQMKAFNFQRSVPYVAEKLEVSRNTIYKYIHEIENEGSH